MSESITIKRCILCGKHINGKTKTQVCSMCGSLNVYTLIKKGYTIKKN